MSSGYFYRYMKDSYVQNDTTIQKERAFKTSIGRVLKKTVLDYWPEMSKMRSIDLRLRMLGDKYGEEVLYWLGYVDCNERHDSTLKYLPFVIPTSLSKEDSENRIDEAVNEAQYTNNQQRHNAIWAEFEREMRIDSFHFLVHQKLKEVISDFFLDELLEMDPQNLRMLDSSVFLMCTLFFIDEVYTLKEDD